MPLPVDAPAEESLPRSRIIEIAIEGDRQVLQAQSRRRADPNPGLVGRGQVHGGPALRLLCDVLQGGGPVAAVVDVEPPPDLGVAVEATDCVVADPSSWFQILSVFLLVVDAGCRPARES